MNPDRADDRATYGVSHADLEAMGERVVRNRLNSGTYGPAGLPPFAFVSAWLADKDFVRVEEAASIAKAAALAAGEAAKLANQARTEAAAWLADKDFVRVEEAASTAKAAALAAAEAARLAHQDRTEAASTAKAAALAAAEAAKLAHQARNISIAVAIISIAIAIVSTIVSVFALYLRK